MPGSQWESSRGIFILLATAEVNGQPLHDVTHEMEYQEEEAYTLFSYKHLLLMFAFNSVSKIQLRDILIHTICHMTGEIVLLISIFLELICFRYRDL